jgi:hypothetical protein
MARTYARFNATTIKRWIAEGRGQGHGPQYKPWLKVQNVPSKGFVNRIKGFKTKRRHELMSNFGSELFLFVGMVEVGD